MFREDDIEQQLPSGWKYFLRVDTKNSIERERLESLEKYVRHFLKTKDVEIGMRNKLERAVEFLIAIEYVPRIDFHFRHVAMHRTLL